MHVPALFEDLGRLFMLDMVLGNADRLPCIDLGWRGNPNNIMHGARGGLLPWPTCTWCTWNTAALYTACIQGHYARGHVRILFFAAGTQYAGRAVAIDSCVQRRPPAARLSREDAAVDRLAQLVGTTSFAAASAVRCALPAGHVLKYWSRNDSGLQACAFTSCLKKATV